MDGQTDRQTYRNICAYRQNTDRHTDRLKTDRIQTVMQIDRYTCIHICIRAHRRTDGPTDIQAEMDRQAKKEDDAAAEGRANSSVIICWSVVT